MPTYTINGKKVTTDKPLSDAEIDEIAASIGGAPVSGVAAIPGSGYYGSPENLAAQNRKENVFSSPGFQRVLSNAQAGAMAVPILAAGVKGAQLLTQGSKAAPFVGNLSTLIPATGKALVGEGLVGAGAGILAGELGEEFERKGVWGGRTAGEFLGGAMGGLLFNIPRNMAGLGSTAKGLFSSKGETLKGVEEGANVVGSIRAREKIEQALKANPNLPVTLQEAEEIFRLTGARLPISAASKGDPTIGSLVAQQASRTQNTGFVAELYNQENAAKAALQEAKKALAADPRSVERYTEMQSAKVAAENARRSRELGEKQANREAGLERINERILDLSDKLATTQTGKTEITTRLQNLVTAREKAVKAEITPLYKQAVEEGQAAGVTMPAENVSNILGLIDRYGMKNLFQASPKIAATIESILGRKTVQQEAPVGKGKVSSRLTQVPMEAQQRTLNAEQADSLKRAVNEALRNNKDPARTPFLRELKDNVDAGISNMGEFGAKLKEVDNLYRTKVGEPFLNANGVVAVDEATFVERTMPLLTGNASSLRQIKNAVGDTPEFRSIARDAWLWKLSNNAGIYRADGEINPKRLERLLKVNKETIAEVPGLEQELRTLGTDVKTLQAHRTKLIEAKKKASVEKVGNLWSEAYGSRGGFGGFVESALKNPEQMSQLIRVAGTAKVAQEGIKSAMLDAAATSANKVKFFEDHADAFSRMFGEDYTKNVRAVLDGMDRLKQYPFRPNPNISGSQITQFEQATGNDPVRTASLLRQQVQSTFYKVSTIFSRFVQNKAEKSEAAEIQEFLLNPKAVKESAEAIKALEDSLRKGGQLSEKALGLARKVMRNNTTAFLYGGTAGAALGELGMLEQRQPVTTQEE